MNNEYFDRIIGLRQQAPNKYANAERRCLEGKPLPSMVSEAIKRRHFAPRNVSSLVNWFSRVGDSGSEAYGENLL